MVTFHHFTTPRWLTDQGGWESGAAVERFGRFCEVVAGALGDVMSRACTINEPNVVAVMGWMAGMFPPGKTDKDQSRAVAQNLIAGHRVAVEAVRGAAPGVPVGLTLSMTDYQLLEGGEAKLESRRHHSEDVFLDATGGDDFLGVQVYTRNRIGPNGWAGAEPGVPVLDMGYEFYPASLANCLRRAWDYTGGSLPLLVTENGIGTTDDVQRIDYVRQALDGVLDAIAEGIDVRGYTYWSLLDNFEWALGYRPRFGLVVGGPGHVRPHAETERGVVLVGGGGQRPRRLGPAQTAASSVLATTASMICVPQALGQVVPHARDQDQLGARHGRGRGLAAAHRDQWVGLPVNHQEGHRHPAQSLGAIG